MTAPPSPSPMLTAPVDAPRLTEPTPDQTVAHRIRNRLTAIVGTSKDLAHRVAGASHSAESLDLAELNARLERIEAAAWAIDELLDHWVDGSKSRVFQKRSRAVAP